MNETKTFTMQGEPTATMLINDPSRPDWCDPSGFQVDTSTDEDEDTGNDE